MPREKPQLAYDPLLRKAAEDIKAVFAKHDIGGTVTLTSKTHHEFLDYIPKWSNIQFLSDGNMSIKFRKATPDINDASLAFFMGTYDLLLRSTHTFMKITRLLKRELKKHNVEFDHTSLVDKEPCTDGLPPP